MAERTIGEIAKEYVYWTGYDWIASAGELARSALDYVAFVSDDFRHNFRELRKQRRSRQAS